MISNASQLKARDAAQTRTFVANSAPEAVEQIRAELGPEAVVLNVRKLPAAGLSRLWQRPQIEVTACVPAGSGTLELQKLSDDPIAELRREIARLRDQVEARREAPPSNSLCAAHPAPAPLEPVSSAADLDLESTPIAKTQDYGSWRVGRLLESSGLLPRHAHRIIEELRRTHGEDPPDSLFKEIDIVRGCLIQMWRARASRPPGNMHVFIGAPAAGKTTVVCKWLARTVLIENRPARVWRLDGSTANTAESLSVYAEILGVRVERCRPSSDARDSGDTVLVDLPGVDWKDSAALRELGNTVAGISGATVHVVLNSAYELAVQVSQLRAFAAVLPVHDLVFTHLDEEARWGKVWNFVLGTNFSVSFLSAGQNVPGDFQPASPESLLDRQFPRK